MGTGVTSPVEVPSPQDFAEIFKFIGGYRISQAIYAADLGTRPVYKGPAPVAAPVPFSWSGF